MLERARRRAFALELDQIKLVEGDAEHIPLADGSVDLFLSYWGLHCMPHPDAAVREIARYLRRGGRVIGAMVCLGPRLRQRLILRPGTRVFGPCGTSDDLARWLAAAGLTQTRLSSPARCVRSVGIGRRWRPSPAEPASWPPFPDEHANLVDCRCAITRWGRDRIPLIE